MEEQEQQMPMSMPMMGGLSSEGALQYQFENDNIVETLLHSFKGEIQVYNHQTKSMVWKKVNKPMVNERGLSIIRSYLIQFLEGAKNWALTDVNDDYIGESVLNIGNVLITDFEDNWNAYDIRDQAAASFMVERVTDIAFTIKKKGESATYLKFLTRTHNISEVQHHQSLSQGRPQQQDGGVLNMLFRKKKRFGG